MSTSRTSSKKETAKSAAKPKSAFRAKNKGQNRQQAIPLNKSVSIPRNQPSGQMRDGKLTISHKEFVNSLNYTATNSEWFLDPLSLNDPGLSVNPANPQLFPWLSNQALGWQQYRFLNISIELLPKNAATMSGWMALMYQPDILDSIPSTKADALQEAYRSEGGVYVPLQLTIPGRVLNNFVEHRYVANRDQVSSYDRSTHAGNFIVGFDGLTPGSTYGFDLWVSYTVEFSLPRSSDTRSSTYIEQVAPQLVYSGGAGSKNYAVSLNQLANRVGTSLGDVVTKSIRWGGTYAGPLNVFTLDLDKIQSRVLQLSTFAAQTATECALGIMTFDSSGGDLYNELLNVALPGSRFLSSPANGDTFIELDLNSLNDLLATYAPTAKYFTFYYSLVGTLVDVNSFLFSLSTLSYLNVPRSSRVVSGSRHAPSQAGQSSMSADVGGFLTAGKTAANSTSSRRVL